MGKTTGGGRLAGHKLTELFRNFLAAHSHHKTDRLDLIHDERVLDDVAVSRDQVRTHIGEAHWFYDKQR
jgi:hypothetical protein